MDNALLTQIITAVVSLVSIIATSIVSIALSKSNHKQELARLEHDYQLKQIDSSMQEKRECYRDVCRIISRVKELVFNLSVEAHKPVDEENLLEYGKKNEKQIKELYDIMNTFKEQTADAYFVSSWLSDYFITCFHVILNRIIMESCENGDPIGFFRSERSTDLLLALERMEFNIFEQARKELGFSKNDGGEIITLNSLNNESNGCILKKTNGEVVLFAGAITKEPPTDNSLEFWTDEFGYVLIDNKTFHDIEEAAKYFMGNKEKYETKQICKL